MQPPYSFGQVPERSIRPRHLVPLRGGGNARSSDATWRQEERSPLNGLPLVPEQVSSRWMACIRVECHSGYRGEETPRRFELDGQTIEITEVLRRWKEPDAFLFRVQTLAGRVFVLRRNEQTGSWDVPEAVG